MVHGHTKADARNLWLHRAALRNLRERPELRQPCLDLVIRWLEKPEQAPSARWLQQWREMLESWTDDRIAGIALDETAGQTLRQCSPLGPALSARERWRLLAEIEVSLS